jgi:hypothetical protein
VMPYTTEACPVVDDGRQCTRSNTPGHRCRFIGQRESTKRKVIITPQGVDLGTVALVMNAITALSVLPVYVSATFWWADYGVSGEFAFRAWVSANGAAFELDESESRPSMYIARKSDRQAIVTWRFDIPSNSHDCHPLHPDRWSDSRKWSPK